MPTSFMCFSVALGDPEPVGGARIDGFVRDASWTAGGAAPATPVRRHGLGASGKHVTTVRVATNGKSHAEFHDVVLWGQLADFACQYLGKGRLVYIEGRLQSRQWQANDGST